MSQYRYWVSTELADKSLVTPRRPRGMGKEAPLLHDPVVIPDKSLRGLLLGKQQECTPLRIPNDLRKGDVVRVETESDRWLDYEGARFWICARVKRLTVSPRRANRIVLQDVVLFPVGRLRFERVTG